MKNKATYMYVSYTLIRKESDDDTSWTDEVHVANEIKSWLQDLDFTVEDMHIKTLPKSITNDWQSLSYLTKEGDNNV
ncbi:hypothetical protein [uncultured Mediterranean phage uvMED]|nr:hypothetical protein [uncultured Mediterranean phage uvMED]BAR16564.1 hypothetical protein [uncultured Mediterranean phage uvMED]